MTNDWSINLNTGRLTTAYSLDLGGNSIQNVSAILSASGKWRIDENGNIVAKKLTAEQVELKDEDTEEIYCVKVKSGILLNVQGECR